MRDVTSSTTPAGVTRLSISISVKLLTICNRSLQRVSADVGYCQSSINALYFEGVSRIWNNPISWRLLVQCVVGSFVACTQQFSAGCLRSTTPVGLLDMCKSSNFLFISFIILFTYSDRKSITKEDTLGMIMLSNAQTNLGDPIQFNPLVESEFP